MQTIMPRETNKTAELLDDFGFHNIERVHGVTCDSELVWFAADDRLVGVDPATGALRRQFEVRANAGTAFDGEHLWQLGGDKIRKIHRETGEVLHTIPAPEGGTNISGMAWAEGFLWLGAYKDKRILKVDAQTGEVVRILESDRFVTGVSWSDGQLWHAVSPDDGHPHAELRRLDPDTGVKQFAVELPEGMFCSGIEVDRARNRIWFGSGGRLRSAKLLARS